MALTAEEESHPVPAQQHRRRELWAWLILGCAATNVIFLGGKRRAFGVFVAQLHAEFNGTISLAELNWIGDSYAAVGYMTTTLSTSVILSSGRRFQFFQMLGTLAILLACITSAFVPNPHWLFLTHTVFHGVGSSLILSTVGLVVNEHFDKQHPYHILATTLVSGGSIASILFVQLYAYLIELYTWRNAFIILGVIYFFVNISGSIFFTKREELPPYSSNKQCFGAFWEVERSKVPYLLLWFLDRVMTSIVTYGMLLNLADYVRRRESSLTKSSHLTLLFASGEASTYAIAAVLAIATKDFLKGRLKYILSVTTFIMACSLVYWEVVASNKTLSYILAYISGFCMGPSITFLFPAGEEMTTLPGHLAYPFSLAGMGVGMALSPSVTAMIAERYEYRYFFVIQGFLIFIKFLALLLIIIMLKAASRRDRYELLKQLDVETAAQQQQQLEHDPEAYSELERGDIAVGRRTAATIVNSKIN
ncbi:hypothetical protein BOX15_Mlig001059g2 [Macrostomum lignano]|uniref:Major facilitator superfamily (MFS) profile domain-containing protein n=1 Tax=Macrostomum lignano TaxID=282301 RepID=A0A267F2B9_9PLAT|nr:hypothetical protein BOX15_Mlig001059g2 [Macrostomum lignano]